MLGTYVGSVIVFMLIMSSAIMICQSSIRKNGWLDKPTESKNSKIVALTALSAVPVFRLFVVAMIFVMAAYPKEKVMAWIEDHKNLNS